MLVVEPPAGRVTGGGALVSDTDVFAGYHSHDESAGAVFAGARRATSYIESPIEERPHAQERIPHRASDELVPSPGDANEVETSEPAESEVLSESPGDVLDGSPDDNEVFTDLDLSVVREPQRSTALTGVRGVLARLGIRVEPGAKEQAALDRAEVLRRDEECIRQATWTRAVSVLVANKKGGTGKTPVSILLGGVLSAVRGGSVAIVEVSDDPGALTFRAEGNPARGVGELIFDRDHISSAGQLAGYTAPQTSFASIIGSVGPRPRLTFHDVIGISKVIDEYYAIRMMDSGNQPSSEAFQGAVLTADVLVVPILNAGDAVLEAVATLDGMRAQGGHSADLANNAIVLRLTDGRPEHTQVVERINRIITAMHVGRVYDIPYDAHIAERGQLTLGKLAPATTAALTAAAAGAIRTLQTTVH